MRKFLGLSVLGIIVGLSVAMYAEAKEPKPADLVTFDRCHYWDGSAGAYADATVDVETISEGLTRGSFGIKNSATGFITQFVGTYAQVSGTWLIQMTITGGGTYTATLDGYGNWHIDIPANTLSQNSNYTVYWTSYHKNGAAKPTSPTGTTTFTVAN